MRNKWKESVGGVKGHTKITLFDKDGNIKVVREQENLITTVGFDFLCQQIGEHVEKGMQYCGIGSSATSADVGDTALGTELGRISGVYAHTASTKIFTNTATFAAGNGTGNVYEAGLSTNSSADTFVGGVNGTPGILVNRQTFGLITKGASDVLQIEWTLTLS